MKKILTKKSLMKKIKYKMCLVFIFKAFRVVLSDITCIIFKAYKKTEKHFYNFFTIYKNVR